MTLYYDFDENEDYPYEVKEQDVEEYVDSLTNEKYRKFAKEIWEELPLEKKEYYIKNYNITKIEDFDAVFPGIYDAMKELITEDASDDMLDSVLGDDMKEYFYDRAYEQFKDSQAYEKDPYGYNGVKESDFY